MGKADTLLASLNKVRKTGDSSWLACCPAHADKSPSLAVRLVENEKILLHCFGGCAVDEVVSAIGFTLADLMPDKIPCEGSKPVNSRIPASDLLAFIQFEATIVQIAARDLLTGKTLSDTDLSRLKLAHERLENAVRMCCR